MSKLLIIAGEASGDLHGGNVIRELNKIRPDLQVIGTGGSVLESENVKLYYRVEDLAVIGFSEVVKIYKRLKNIFNDLVAKLDTERPDAVLLVDYPAFNLKFAKEAKKRGIKVFFYIAPQVWAWKKKRIEVIRKYVDELIVLFPFEVEFFKKEGMKTHCFGHPLLDITKPSLDKEEVFRQWLLDPEKKTISILPGSRKNEILKHLPLLFETIDEINQKQQGIQFVFPLAPTVKKDVFQPFMEVSKADIRLVENDTYNMVAHSDFALVASGTATLETTILKTPLMIFYKSSLLTYIIGKYLLRIQAIGLPNIISGKLVVPEDPHFSSPKRMSRDVLHYLEDPDEYNKIKNNMAEVLGNLGNTGAYKKTAEFIDRLI